MLVLSGAILVICARIPLLLKEKYFWSRSTLYFGNVCLPKIKKRFLLKLANCITLSVSPRASPSIRQSLELAVNSVRVSKLKPS